MSSNLKTKPRAQDEPTKNETKFFNSKTTVPLERIILMFVMTKILSNKIKIKKILIGSADSKVHQGKIINFPWFKYEIDDSRIPSNKVLLQTAFKACFGEDEDSYDDATEGGNFTIGNTLYQVYYITEASKICTVMMQKNRYLIPLISLRNRSKVKVEKEIHTIPKSIQTVVNKLIA